MIQKYLPIINYKLLNSIYIIVIKKESKIKNHKNNYHKKLLKNHSKQNLMITHKTLLKLKLNLRKRIKMNQTKKI